MKNRNLIIAVAVSVAIIVALVIYKRSEGWMIEDQAIRNAGLMTLGTVQDVPQFEVSECKNCSLCPYICSPECMKCYKEGKLVKNMNAVHWNTQFPYGSYIGTDRRRDAPYIHEYTDELGRCGTRCSRC